MRILLTMLGGLALMGQPAIAVAQAAKKPGAATAKPAPKAAPKAAIPSAPTANDLKEATETLSLLVSALNSKDIPADTKAGLLLCLYKHPLGLIARNQAGALAANQQVDASSPTQRLLVIATICGAPIPKADATGPAVGDASPAPMPTPSTGR